jgi:signal transduction histidine kinase
MTSIRFRLSAVFRIARPGDAEQTLRAVTWAVRGGALVLVGVVVFSRAPAGTGQGPLQAAAFAVACLMTGLWALIESPAGHGRLGRSLAWPLTAMTVACGAAAASPDGGPLISSGFIAMVSAGSDISVLAGWVAAGLGVIAIESASIIYGAGSSVMLGYPLVLLVGLLLGHNRRSYRLRAEQSAALLARAGQLREEQARLAALDERARIAREIHDVLAHSLGALGLQIQAARAVLTEQHDAARTAEMLEQAHRLAADGLSETRRAVRALRSDTPPLPDGLAELGTAHQQRHRVPVTVAVGGQPRPLSPDAGLALLRTAQEALVNAAKHAPGQPAGISLGYGGDRVTLTVTSALTSPDGAPGFETLNAGYGLTGLRERLLLIGGTLRAGPAGDRWVVTAEVPR